MKANELQIGDWAHSSFFGCTRVESIEESDGYGWVRTNGERKSDASLTPIPLTEEVLLANGFYKGSYVGSYLHRDFVFRVYPINSDSSATSFVQEESPIYETVFYCCYVHELQHALKLCGLGDLANNFKVK